MAVEGAFGRAKGRWRCLLKRFDGVIDSVSLVVGVCFTLHNICEIYGEQSDPEWLAPEEEDNVPNMQTPDDLNAEDIRQGLIQRFQLNPIH